jgi:hypothetical protein
MYNYISCYNYRSSVDQKHLVDRGVFTKTVALGARPIWGPLAYKAINDHNTTIVRTLIPMYYLTCIGYHSVGGYSETVGGFQYNNLCFILSIAKCTTNVMSYT